MRQYIAVLSWHGSHAGWKISFLNNSTQIATMWFNGVNITNMGIMLLYHHSEYVGSLDLNAVRVSLDELAE